MVGAAPAAHSRAKGLAEVSGCGSALTRQDPGEEAGFQAPSAAPWRVKSSEKSTASLRSIFWMPRTLTVPSPA